MCVYSVWTCSKCVATCWLLEKLKRRSNASMWFMTPPPPPPPPRSITPVVFTAGWVGDGGGGSLHPLPRIRQTLINWEECKQAAETQGSTGWRVEGEGPGWGRTWGEERERRKRRSRPHLPLLLVNSPPRRLIQCSLEQCSSWCRGGPGTWWPYGLQTSVTHLHQVLFQSHSCCRLNALIEHWLSWFF